MLHNETIFPEPRKFKPERWFNATEQQNKCFVPFGKGTRACIGQEYVTYAPKTASTAKPACTDMVR